MPSTAHTPAHARETTDYSDCPMRRCPQHYYTPNPRLCIPAPTGGPLRPPPALAPSHRYVQSIAIMVYIILRQWAMAQIMLTPTLAHSVTPIVRCRRPHIPGPTPMHIHACPHSAVPTPCLWLLHRPMPTPAPTQSLRLRNDCSLL